MTPLADVTANISPSSAVRLDISGRWACLVDASRIVGALDLTDGATIAAFTFTTEIVGSTVEGFDLDPYRNNIPNLLWDENSQRFCGYVGVVPATNNPLSNAPAFQICGKDGAAQFVPKFSGKKYGASPTENITVLSANNGSFIGFVTAGWGDFEGKPVIFGGILDNGDISSQPIQSPAPENLYTIFIDGDPVTSLPSYSYSIVLCQNTTGGNQQACHCYNAGTTISNEIMINITEIQFPYNNELRGVHNFPGWGLPIWTDQNIDDPVMTNVGPEYNVNFQSAFINSMTICAWDGPGGTGLDPTTGLPVHGGSYPAPFDVDIGPGQYFSPLCPPTFNFNGVQYTLVDDSQILAMTILNGNLSTLATYSTTGGGSANATLLMIGGIYNLTILKSDTLNWKMSLTYGMSGPGSLPPEGTPDAGIYPSGGRIELTPEVEYTGTPGELDEDLLP